MTKQIETHLTANMNLKKRQIIMYNFLGGLAWGLGTVIGASVVVAVIGAVLHALGLFDFFNSLTINTFYR